jgi:uroporphyrin-3 C-methyltransferase/uroporphyrinogen III methyltransferase/synthase
MNEIPSSSESGTSTSSVPPQQETAVSGTVSPQGGFHVSQRSLAIGIGVLALLLAAEWWSMQSEIHTMREEMAHRLQTNDVSNSEVKLIAKSTQEGMKELQAKVSVLESKQIEAQSQQLALEQLYQDLSKNRDEWALSEIDQVLSTASQQLQLAGNVEGALIALQNADKSLSRSDKPQFITIRRAIAHDMDRLKAFPTVDVTGIALRLDSVISQADYMPLLSDEKPVTPVSQPKKSHRTVSKASGNANSSARADWVASLQDRWDSWTSEMWTEIKQLIRVRTVDNPDALLLSPTQAYYARENLKLRLLNARLALLSRNESAFRSDLIAAQDIIGKYFDTRSKQTQTVQVLLKQVQGSNLALQAPTLAESLNAVRNYKAR